MNLDIIVREATINDTQALIDLKMNYLKDSETIPLNIQEYKNDFDSEFHLIETLNVQKNSVLFVATVNKKIVGNLDVFGNQRERLFHTGNLGMGIHNEWQNKGIGSKLIEATIEWAQQNEFIKLITLDVYATNRAARHLYKKFNFIETGQINNFFYQDGAYLDKINMVNYL